MSGERVLARVLPITLLAFVTFLPGGAAAQERYALIVSGASGGPAYAESYDRWQSTLTLALRHRLQVREENLFVLSERPAKDGTLSTRDGVESSIGTLRDRMRAGDTLLVVLIGHGTFDGVDAKFNLVGADLEAAEWDRLLARLPGHLVLVNTTSAGAPFVERLARPGRVLVSATDSAAQRYDTIFPEFFASAFDDRTSDLDKNGRVSIWEAFVYASEGVRRWYEERGRLSTERPVLDDDGDGVGREAGAPGSDGSLAQVTYLDTDLDADQLNDPALKELLERRVALEGRLEALKARKADTAVDAYRQELESLLVELARLSRELRQSEAGVSRPGFEG